MTKEERRIYCIKYRKDHRERVLETKKNYRKKHRQQISERAKQFRKLNKLQVHAQYVLNKALQKRIILKGINCKNCGSSKVEAHHHLGYAKEHWLDVIWLCHRCHINEHIRRSKNGKSTRS